MFSSGHDPGSKQRLLPVEIALTHTRFESGSPLLLSQRCSRISKAFGPFVRHAGPAVPTVSSCRRHHRPNGPPGLRPRRRECG
jgi:hypothetical protein